VVTNLDHYTLKSTKQNNRILQLHNAATSRKLEGFAFNCTLYDGVFTAGLVR
jgi:hypothetical protein